MSAAPLLLSALLLAPPAGTNAPPVGDGEAGRVELFDGKTLAGWTGEKGLWAVEPTPDGDASVPAIVGRSDGLDHNTFLTTTREFADFDLTFEVKLTPDAANSGVQFRSVRLPRKGSETVAVDGEMRGYQADMGKGWWGKLYEESARGMLYPAEGKPEQESAGAAVKPGEWTVYRIRAEGDRIRTWLNGTPSVDLVDPDGRKTGLIGLQMHSGGPMVVRWRRFVLREL